MPSITSERVQMESLLKVIKKYYQNPSQQAKKYENRPKHLKVISF